MTSSRRANPSGDLLIGVLLGSVSTAMVNSWLPQPTLAEFQQAMRGQMPSDFGTRIALGVAPPVAAGVLANSLSLTIGWFLGQGITGLVVARQTLQELQDQEVASLPWLSGVVG